jgi:hypothetical protein
MPIVQTRLGWTPKLVGDIPASTSDFQPIFYLLYRLSYPGLKLIEAVPLGNAPKNAYNGLF